MQRLLQPLLWLTLVAGGWFGSFGCNGGTVDGPTGTEGAPCYGNGTCDSPLVCSASKSCVKPLTDPCEGIRCSGHGTCEINAGDVSCTCDDGYHAKGLDCLDDADPCSGQTCSGHGACALSEGSATCSCEEGYRADGLACVLQAGPAISAVSAYDITQTTARITWTLDEPATGQVEYGTTTAYGQFSLKETSFNYSSHIQMLSGLTPATLYHFRVHSENEANAESVSGDYTFTTAGLCDGVTCSDHGTCSVTADSATCACDKGYHAAGLACIADGLPSGCASAPPPTSALVVNVRDTGAKCDGVTDDTAAIQRAVDQVGGTGGTVLVPKGTCMVNAIAAHNSYNVNYGVFLKSDMTFKMESGAVLKATPNGSWNYNVLYAEGCRNLNIVGGTVEGERHEHLTPGDDALTTSGDPRCVDYGDCEGQWGYCVSLWGSSNVFVEGVTARECWGDGFTIWGEGRGGSNITLSCVIADDNRRQGLSIVSGHGILVENSIFKGTYGHAPAAAIDVEPDATMAVDDVRILNNQFLDNHGGGVELAALNGDVSNVTVDGNISKRNGWGLDIYSAWNGSGAAATGNTVTNNTIVITGLDRAGLYLAQPGTAGNTVTGNVVCGPLPFLNENAGANTVADNSLNPSNCAALAASAP